MTVNKEEYLNYISQPEDENGNKWSDIQGSPFEYGEDVGYTLIDFTYPGDLIGDAGATVTDILEQIKTVLGNYEYFYDIDGNFVFQQIKNYLNNAQSKYILDSLINRTLVPDYIDAKNDPGMQAYLINTSSGTSCFEFNDSNLISSYSNTPQYSKIKNDYVVWGIKTLSDGRQLPIRYHLAIDKKPKPGNIYKVFEYKDPDNGIKKWYAPIEFQKKENFPETGVVGFYYLDKENNIVYTWEVSDEKCGWVEIGKNIIKEIITTDWRTELYFQGVAAEPFGTESNYYYAQLLNEWPKIYEYNETQKTFKIKEEILEDPNSLEYYLDIIDTQSEIAELAVNNIGRRTQVLNEDKNVNCIFQPWIPDVVLINIEYSGDKSTGTPAVIRKECEKRGQHKYQVKSEIFDNLAIGGVLNSAYEVIKQLLHEYTSYNETISIQTIPIYFLEPNTRISVHDTKSNIHGDYMINSMSFTLDSSSLLTINATKALSKI